MRQGYLGCGRQIKRTGQGVAGKLDSAPGVSSVELHVRGKWVATAQDRQYPTLDQRLPQGFSVQIQPAFAGCQRCIHIRLVVVQVQ